MKTLLCQKNLVRWSFVLFMDWDSLLRFIAFFSPLFRLKKLNCSLLFKYSVLNIQVTSGASWYMYFKKCQKTTKKKKSVKTWTSMVQYDQPDSSLDQDGGRVLMRGCRFNSWSMTISWKPSSLVTVKFHFYVYIFRNVFLFFQFGI